MFEFDLGRNCSSGLMTALRAQGYDVSGETFEIDIYKGPVVAYLESAPGAFTKTLHIGCTTDTRPPSIGLKAERHAHYGVLRFFYERDLFFNVKDIWKRKDGERDLEVMVKQLSDNKSYRERLILHWFRNQSGRSFTVNLELQKNKIMFFYGLDELQSTEEDVDRYFRQDTCIKGTVLDFIDGPHKGEDVLASPNGSSDELEKLGLSAGEFIGHYVRLFNPALVGDVSLLAGLRFATREEVDEFFS